MKSAVPENGEGGDVGEASLGAGYYLDTLCHFLPAYYYPFCRRSKGSSEMPSNISKITFLGQDSTSGLLYPLP